MAAWIIDTMKASGLRGRGGAGFPTGLKWSFVPKQSEKPKYVLVNGDESEPGTCKDHVIFREDPHAVIEGTMIAGLAIGSKIGFIYLRGEYRYLLKIVEKAVADAYARGFLGKNIFGSGLDFDIITQTGAGAYEVGEESALMESLEGKRGVPRIKPPFPAVVGLYGGPTVINNAETIASAPHILLMGGEAYAKLGTSATAARASSASAATSSVPASTSCPWATTSKRPSTTSQAASRTARSSRPSFPADPPARSFCPKRST